MIDLAPDPIVEAVDRLTSALACLRLVIEPARQGGADEGAIGKAIGRLRRAARMTQHDIAYALSISRGAVAQWETGRTDPPARRLPDLARLLNCNIQQLFEG